MDEVEQLIHQLEHKDIVVEFYQSYDYDPGDWRERDRNAPARVEALGNLGRREALSALEARLPYSIPWLGGEQDKNVRAAIRPAIEKIEKATAATATLPIPATTPTSDAAPLPRPADAPTQEVDKLPRPADNDQ